MSNMTVPEELNLIGSHVADAYLSLSHGMTVVDSGVVAVMNGACREEHPRATVVRMPVEFLEQDDFCETDRDMHDSTCEVMKLDWESPLPTSTAYCDIPCHLGNKLDAGAGHATRVCPGPYTSSEESVGALARNRGAKIEVEYAEAFGMLQLIV